MKSIIGPFAGAVLIAALSPLAASADTAPYLIYFDSTSTVDVSDVAIFNLGANSCCGYGFAANGQEVPVGESVLTDGFLKTDVAAGAFLAGIADEPSIAESAVVDSATALLARPSIVAVPQGAVIFANDSFVQANLGNSFSTAFPGLSETDLISWLEDPNDNVGNLFNFADTYGSAVAFVPGQAYSEIEFSDGQLVGTGVSFEVPNVSPAPEPSTWLLIMAGIGAVGLMLRQAKRKMALRFENELTA